MADRATTKLPPFHETVKMALIQSVVGVGFSESKQGEILALLGLIEKTDIPAAQLPEVATICGQVADGIETAVRYADSTYSRSQLKRLVELAREVALGLGRRVEG